jgi:hypothetical protein
VSSAFGEGEVVARLRCASSEVQSVAVELVRPLRILASLRERPPQDCLRLLPLLFPLCGSAHALAALMAIEAAAGLEPEPAHRAARDTIALADAFAAHVWRVQLDWTALTEQAAKPFAVAQARRLVEAIATALYPDGDWRAVGGGRLAPDAVLLVRAREQLQQLRASIDLDRSLAALRARLASAMVGADSVWVPKLQSCFMDMAQAMLTNFELLYSRLLAISQLPPVAQFAGAQAALACANNRGCGDALTSRGVLRYEVQLRAGVVAGCRLEAPVDRVFAPQGTAQQLLARLRHAANPALAARWILAAFDPCTQVRVELEEQGAS